MRVGLWLPTFAADTVTAADTRVVELARLAERCGLDGLWAIDHMLPTTGEVHSGSWYDPIVSLTAAAAVTESLELGTASLVAGPRHPVALAKQVASLAALAGPRVTIGVSSGWAPEEYECFGYRLIERGRAHRRGGGGAAPTARDRAGRLSRTPLPVPCCATCAPPALADTDPHRRRQPHPRVRVCRRSSPYGRLGPGADQALRRLAGPLRGATSR